MISWAHRFDHRVLTRVNRWKPPRWLWILAVVMSRGGDGWLWMGVGAAIAVFGGREAFSALASANLSVALGIGVFSFMKRRFRRSRPPAELRSWPTLVAPDRFSFPSGHATTAFAVSVSLFPFFPHFRLELVALASGVAASRVFLGLHFLTDVLAGSLIGSLVGLGVSAIIHFIH